MKKTTIRKTIGKNLNIIIVTQRFPTIIAMVHPVETAIAGEIGSIKAIPQIIYFLFPDSPLASK